MGIFSRFQDIVNANITALLDRAEDPQKMIRMMIQEMQETLVEVRTASAKVIADRKSTERKLENLQKEAAEWESKAGMALSKGREDLARAALAEHATVAEMAQQTAEELEQINLHLDELNNEITLLQRKLDDAKAKQKSLVAREQSARSRLDMRRRFSREKLDDAFAKFDQYERRMDDLEAEVESYDLGSKDLASEIDDLARNDKVDKALAELKARMEKQNSGE
ncbi:phage shock protein PspA [Oceanospirillum sediminis]|uniref:Phage shock protein PspA n=1 Tax=Oceanospirillum sediminis TaxID=2760088 RepID=A0A839IUB2_9GAMM|nr:phage shock protein PspA [Oceanospirillum sediminis]MBB1488521.1 phage shock protein PspA [Oceanospirillum sediminis]